MTASRRLVLLAVLALAGPPAAVAHPTDPNQAISAPTIAQLFVTDTEIRLELEIGPAGQAVFAELTADGARAEPSPAQQRFMDRGWVIEADGDITLRGRVTIVEPRRRVTRDAVTGEPLPPGGPPGEPVTFAEVRYPLSGRPANIHLKPPPAVIGFVAHHSGVPVSDFDVLKRPVSFRLDWDDPWKSRFRGLRFQRYYNAPVWAGLTVEPRAVRVEIVARPGVAAEWPDPNAVGTLPALGDRVRAWLLSKVSLTVDGQPAKPVAEPVRYLRQTLAKIEAVPGPADVPVAAVFFQFTFHVPVTTRPREVVLKLDLFNGPVAASPLWVNSGDNPATLSAANPSFTWKDQSADETALPPLPESVPRWWLPLPSLIVGALGFFWVVPGFPPFRSRSSRLVGFLAVTALAAGLWPVGQIAVLAKTPAVPVPEDEHSKRLVWRMLTEAYRAFDCRDEEAVYDTLAESVSGPLLREAYLSIRRMLDAPDQAGRVRVRSVTVKTAALTPLDDGPGFRAKCVWVMEAAVTHRGHTHTRSAEYDGELTIRPRDGRWKIDALAVLDERRAAPAPVWRKTP